MVHKFPLDNSEDLTELVNLVTELSDSKKDQQSTDKHTVTTLRVLKNRYSGITGTAGSLSYDVNTSQYNEVTQTTSAEEFEDF